MKEENIPELVAAPFTPMDASGNLKLDVIPAYAKHLANSGLSGAFVCGTTGEGISMTVIERKAVLEKWMESKDNGINVICHVGGNCLSECQDLARHAENCGASATAAYAPTFFRPGSAAELVSFLEPIAAAAPGIPFCYYHMPSMNHVNLPVSEIIQEADRRIPNFGGVKFTHFDLYELQKCVAYKDGKYKIFNGHDEILICALSLGIRSAVGSTYNYIAPLYLKIWEAFQNGDLKEANQWQQLSVMLVTILNKYGGAIRAGKAIMKIIGLDCGPCRLPISQLKPEEFKNLRNDLNEIDFLSLTSKELLNKKREVPLGQ